MGSRANPPGGAARSIEHPGRNLQRPNGCRTREAAAENPAAGLLDHLMNVDPAPGPWMPWIKKLAFIGPVGVVSSCCTIPDVLIHRLTGKPRIRLLQRVAANLGCGMTEAEIHLRNPARLFRRTRPALIHAADPRGILTAHAVESRRQRQKPPALIAVPRTPGQTPQFARRKVRPHLDR